MRPELDLLGPALETAVRVARDAERAGDGPAPRSIRPFLTFSRLPPPARQAVHAAVEIDPGFRSAVAAAADEASVGRAGWLWLARPEGWEVELAELVAAHELGGDERRERSAHRQLDRARRAIARLEERLAHEAAELAEARRRLAEREAAAGDVAGEVTRLRARAEVAEGERARAVRELKATERRLTERIAGLRAELDERGAGESAASAGPDVALPAEVAAAMADAVAALRRRWDEAGGAIDALEDAVAAIIGPAAAGGADRGTDGAVGATAGAARRRPVRLRRGLVDDSAAAVEWLLGRPGAVVLVDGYNVTMGAWPELSVADQRRALEQVATELQVRTGAHLVLVFDGDGEHAAPAVRTAIGSAVRVRFTAQGAEADDEILAMVDASDAPVVVVVSADRRVRDGARRLGANVARPVDLLALARTT